LSYLGIVIANAIASNGRGSSTADRVEIFFSTLAVLGILVLALGVGWLPLRRLLMRLLPAAVIRHLPPGAAAA
jgi:hypothetical protein